MEPLGITNLYTTAVKALGITNNILSPSHSIQLSGEGEVNSTYQEAKRRGKYRALFTDPEGESCFSIYQQLNKNQKVTFCNLKNSLSRNFVYNLQTLSSAVFTILLQIHHENNFLPTSVHQQAKVRRFLGICLFDCFIYRSNFVFPKCLETRSHLGSGRKTVNSQGYSELPGANQNARKLLLTGLVNTKKPPCSERIL